MDPVVRTSIVRACRPIHNSAFALLRVSNTQFYLGLSPMERNHWSPPDIFVRITAASLPSPAPSSDRPCSIVRWHGFHASRYDHTMRVDVRRVSEQLNQVSRLLHELQSQRRDAGLEQLTASPKLHTTMKDLRVAEAQLLEKNQTLCEALFAMEAERKLYCDLFDLAPDGYLVTDEAGTILETNRA